MVSFLFGPEAKDAKTAALQLHPDQIENKLVTLRNQRTLWRDNGEAYRAKHKEDHLYILQQGVVLYFAQTFHTLSAKNNQPAEDTVLTVILADLLQKQSEDFDSVMNQIQGKVNICKHILIGGYMMLILMSC